jgi:hypothetical protein
MILNHAQAEAAYSAMCALNNVGGRIDVSVPASGSQPKQWGWITVRENLVGEILVQGCGTEIYDDQAAFAIAYRVLL